MTQTVQVLKGKDKDETRFNKIVLFDYNLVLHSITISCVSSSFKVSRFLQSNISALLINYSAIKSYLYL